MIQKEKGLFEKQYAAFGIRRRDSDKSQTSIGHENFQNDRMKPFRSETKQDIQEPFHVARHDQIKQVVLMPEIFVADDHWHAKERDGTEPKRMSDGRLGCDFIKGDSADYKNRQDAHKDSLLDVSFRT
jgi:hypothetical protein